MTGTLAHHPLARQMIRVMDLRAETRAATDPVVRRECSRNQAQERRVLRAMRRGGRY